MPHRPIHPPFCPRPPTAGSIDGDEGAAVTLGRAPTTLPSRIETRRSTAEDGRYFFLPLPLPFDPDASGASSSGYFRKIPVSLKFTRRADTR